MSSLLVFLALWLWTLSAFVAGPLLGLAIHRHQNPEENGR